MNLPRSRKTVYEWNDDDKNWWSRRSSLEKKLVILLVVIGVLTVGFLIYYSIIRIAGAIEICNTPGCLVAASNIIAHIDTSIDPCENFYKFACGKLIQDTHGDVEAIRNLDIDNLIERQLKEIIEEPINDDEHYLIKSQKKLYQACLNETAIEEESLDIFKQTIKELRGWPVAVGYHWKAIQFDWQDMIYELRRRGYDYFMMLVVFVPIALTRKFDNTVIIGEPIVESIKDEHKDLYIKYMVDVAVAFGAERHFATLEMKQVFEFMKNLEKIVDESHSRSFDDNNGSDDEKFRTITVEELQRNYTQVEWLEFINTIISPLANISSDDYVLFPNSDFMKKFLYLIYRTSKRTQANYIIWTTLQSIMPYMPKELKQLQANYTCLTVQHQDIQDRSDFCKEIVDESFIPGFTEIIYSRKYLSEEKKLLVEELFGSIRSQFSVSIMETTWIDDESKENCSARVDAITPVIGFEEDYFNDTIFDNLIIPNDTLEDFGDDSFLNLLLISKKRLTDVWYYQISMLSNDSNLYLHMAASILNIIYSAPNNRFLLSPKILQEVYYNEDNTNYLNYGALGFLIGEALVYGFEEDFWTEETEESFNDKIECFAQNIEEFGLENDNNKNHTITARENLNKNIGLNLAYKAYRKWVEENAEEPHLPGIEYTPNQLFWVSAILPQCYTLTEEEISKDFLAGTLLNNPNFAEDFSCSADSRMNPSEICEIF